ncbi:MAG: flagellar biosynthesis regulator FlaF [Roseovarius sp.]
MNALHQAKTAYRTVNQPTQTPRGIEYQAFAKITHRLKQAGGARGPNATRAMIAAIHDNRKLWNALASDVATPENGLPEELRARILYLAEFTRLHSSKVLNKQARADTLVEINTAVMSGLRMRSVTQ